jgi:hypothetical protein
VFFFKFFLILKAMEDRGEEKEAEKRKEIRFRRREGPACSTPAFPLS